VSPVAPLEEVAGAPLDAYVPILAAAAGMDSRPLEALLDQGPDAVVLIALGAGHVPEPMLPAIDRAIDGGVPLIVCARPAEGGTLERTYGFTGSESDLLQRGAIMAGAASPWKARMRAILAAAIDADPRDLLR
jgi:L-asparaginase